MKASNRAFKINVLVFIILTIVLFLLMLDTVGGLRHSYREGDIAQTNIFTNRRILDEIETERLKEEAFDSVEVIKTENINIRENTFANINKLFDEIVTYRAGDNPGLGRKIAEIRQTSKEINSYEISDDEIKALLELESNKVLSLKNNIETVIRSLYDEGIENRTLSSYKERAVQEFAGLEANKNIRSFSNKVFNRQIKANLFDDLAKTKEARDKKVAEVEDVYLEKGDLISSKGATLESREILLIKESGLMKEGGHDYPLYIGLIFLVLLFASIIFLSLISEGDFFEGKKFIPVAITVIIFALFYSWVIKYNPYVFPVAFAVILITMIAGYRVSNFVLAFLILYFSFNPLFLKELVVSGLIQAVFLATALKKERVRREMLKLGLLSGLIAVISMISLDLIRSASIVDSIINYITVFITQIIASILALGAIPIVELLFKTLTPFKLLELSNTNNKLMKQLKQEAPGTYQHSIAVSNLAEQAAEAIGADSLLVRVMSYYHDIGKLKRPLLFSENQIGIDNPHNQMEPIMSSGVILSHIKDGIQIAKEEKLPKEIIQGIQEHHGTTLVQYFYYKAKEDLSGVPINEEEFRYNGPRPQTKETVILMLADSCEAAVRSIKDINMENISEMVEKVIKGKIDDNQFTNANITFKEINIIKESFLKYFKTFYHDRIEYPKEKNDGNFVSE